MSVLTFFSCWATASHFLQNILFVKSQKGCKKFVWLWIYLHKAKVSNFYEPIDDTKTGICATKMAELEPFQIFLPYWPKVRFELWVVKLELWVQSPWKLLKIFHHSPTCHYSGSMGWYFQSLSVNSHSLLLRQLLRKEIS